MRDALRVYAPSAPLRAGPASTPLQATFKISGAVWESKLLRDIEGRKGELQDSWRTSESELKVSSWLKSAS
jgi:hypothetical protein